MIDGNMLTGTNHGDGGLYINPLISIDARMNKDETVEVGFLNATQCILNGVVILLEENTLTLLGGINTYLKFSREHFGKATSWCKKNTLRCKISIIKDFLLPAYYPCLCICQDYCRNALQSLALHVHLYTATQRRKNQSKLLQVIKIFI